jgi:hypothetical protein
MGYEIAWEDDEQKTMRLTFVGKWNWQDVYEARDTIHEMLDIHPRRVNFIVAWDNENWLPMGHKRHMPRLVPDTHPNIRRIIYVLKSPLFRRLLMLYFWRLGGFGFEFDIAESISDARLLLSEYGDE